MTQRARTNCKQLASKWSYPHCFAGSVQDGSHCWLARRSLPPRMANNAPTVPKDGAIPATPAGFPDTIDYDAAKKRLKIGSGFIDNVQPAVWPSAVSGKQVLRQWFSYRKKNRERPQIGDRRPPSPLGEIQPDHWLSEYTTELINVLNVLALLVELEPQQAKLLEAICSGPLIPAGQLAS